MGHGKPIAAVGFRKWDRETFDGFLVAFPFPSWASRKEPMLSLRNLYYLIGHLPYDSTIYGSHENPFCSLSEVGYSLWLKTNGRCRGKISRDFVT